MKWQQRVRVATGLSCWQIMLHLLVVALLVVGWMSKTLVHVGVGLCALYCVTVVMMLVFQRHPEQRWRKIRSYITLRLNIAYAADPVVAVITSSGHKLFHTISRLASFK
ncbi:hypothetical protein FR931_002987 [Escherichia coli]|nr:hypothetical protein [Escherichia coli]